MRSKCLGWTVAFVFHLYFIFYIYLCISFAFLYFFVFVYSCICDSKFKVTVATQGCGERVSGGGKHLSLYSVHCIQYTLYSICIYTLYNICNYTLYYTVCIVSVTIHCIVSVSIQSQLPGAFSHSPLVHSGFWQDPHLHYP